MMRRVTSRRGQVLIMVTLVLIVMCGVLGLAVDLGWAYYVKKSAQAAVDSAVISSAQAAYAIVGQIGPASCASLTCQSTPAPCPASLATPTNNLETGCVYAAANGFSFQGNGGRQNVTMAADTTSPPPTAPNVDVEYWVTARAYESIPQLFSAVMGNFWGASSARATAAVAKTIVPGNLYALNWENDPGFTRRGGGGIRFREGVGMYLHGDSTIDAVQGAYIASSADGSERNYWAVMSDGSVEVISGGTYIRDDGVADHPDIFTAAPENLPDTEPFLDPMRGKGQPPAPGPLTTIPVQNGEIPGDCTANGGAGTILPPGAYYATDLDTGLATGDPIRITGGCVQFTGGGQFGDYAFYGGLQFPSTGVSATFGPGRYFMVGALPGNPLFYVRNGNLLQDMTPLDGAGNAQPPLDAGEIFVFTAPGYPGLTPPGELSPIIDQLQFGYVEVRTGNNDGSLINLHGLNGSPGYDWSSIDSRLEYFAPTLFWMDQRNSQILYTPDGNIDTTSCGPGHTLANPCLNTDPEIPIDPFMQLIASPNADLYGVIYMPRGSYLDFQGSPGMTSPLQVIAGAINMGGGGLLRLNTPTNRLTRRTVALIE